MCSLLNHFTCTIDAVTKNGNPKFIHLLRQSNAKIQFQWTWNIQSNSWYWISSGCYNITFILSYIIKFLKESPMWSLWHHNEPIIWLIRQISTRTNWQTHIITFVRVTGIEWTLKLYGKKKWLEISVQNYGVQIWCRNVSWSIINHIYHPNEARWFQIITDQLFCYGFSNKFVRRFGNFVLNVTIIETMCTHILFSNAMGKAEILITTTKNRHSFKIHKIRSGNLSTEDTYLAINANSRFCYSSAHEWVCR